MFLSRNLGFRFPSANRELTVAHIDELPVLRAKRTLISIPPACISYARNEACCHIVIVRGVRIPEHRVFHQSCNSPRQCTLFRPFPAVPNERIFNALSEFEHGSFWRVWLCEVVGVGEHLSPVVAV